MSKKSNYSRRDLLRDLSLAVAGEQVLSAQNAQHVHETVAKAAAKGPYRPRRSPLTNMPRSSGCPT